MVAIRVYVEGGGNTNRTITKCRRGFSELLRKVMPPKTMPRIIACGGRSQTFNQFLKAVRMYPEEFCVLLVDSEGPVPPAENPCAYLRRTDNWRFPDNVSEEQIHLMVQLLEAWFLADRDALRDFYGQEFNVQALPARTDIRNIPKNDVVNGLK